MISVFRMGPATSGRRLCDIDSVLFGVTKSLVRKIGLFDFNKVHSKQDRIIDYVCSYQVYFHRTRTSYSYDMCFSNFE